MDGAFNTVDFPDDASEKSLRTLFLILAIFLSSCFFRSILLRVLRQWTDRSQSSKRKNHPFSTAGVFFPFDPYVNFSGAFSPRRFPLVFPAPVVCEKPPPDYYCGLCANFCSFQLHTCFPLVGRALHFVVSCGSQFSLFRLDFFNEILFLRNVASCFAWSIEWKLLSCINYRIQFYDFDLDSNIFINSKLYTYKTLSNISSRK